MSNNKTLFIDSHEILWTSRKLTVERACVHEGTPDPDGSLGWDVRNVYLVEAKTEEYVRRDGYKALYTELSLNEARALAAVLLEFARDK